MLAPVALACVLLALAGAAAPGAGATSVEGGNSFNELSQKAQETTSTAATTTTSTTGSSSASKNSNSNSIIFIGIGAAVVLLLGIGFVIVRDARRVAPAGAEDLIDGRSGKDNTRRHANRRQKAKAARRQRKKNR